MRGRERTARQLDGPRGRIEPCRSYDKGEDDGDRRRENKGSRNGETDADRALIFSGSRRIPGRRTVAGRAENALRPTQVGDAVPAPAEFMDMPDRESELQRQSEQGKPRTAAAWYHGNALDHAPIRLVDRSRRRKAGRKHLALPNYRRAQRVAPLKFPRSCDPRSPIGGYSRVALVIQEASAPEREAPATRPEKPRRAADPQGACDARG